MVHVVSSSKFAQKAEEAGCDAVVAEGFEAGGHNGREETASMVSVSICIYFSAMCVGVVLQYAWAVRCTLYTFCSTALCVTKVIAVRVQYVWKTKLQYCLTAHALIALRNIFIL